MTSTPTLDQHRFHSLEERLHRLADDVTGLRRSHGDLRSEISKRFDIMDTRFDTMEARLEIMIEEIRRFFRRYEHVDAERGA
jgi:hypothetical protein